MQLLYDISGTSWSRPAVRRDDHDALLSQLVRLSAFESDSPHISSVIDTWNRLLEKATQVEWVALKRIAVHWAEGDLWHIQDEYLLDLPIGESCRSMVRAISAHRRISRLRQLQAILRAKLLRRIDAEGRGRTRLSLTGSFNCLTRQTGSAAATARRMFPLGAPPAGA
jgi:hypothetical protein